MEAAQRLSLLRRSRRRRVLNDLRDPRNPRMNVVSGSVRAQMNVAHSGHYAGG